MKIAVVGAGISGLSCAYYLGRAAMDVTVFDPAPGGSIGSEQVEGCLLETGPESWLASKPWAEQLVRELGMADELVDSNDAQRKTYVLRNGRFVRLPEGLQLVVPTKALATLDSPLLGLTTKARMALDIFRSPKASPDRSVSEFVREHFGQEAVDYLAEPLLSGVYGGSPDHLSAPSVLPKFVEYEQRYGSLVVGSLRNRDSGSSPKAIFRSLRRGMGSLIQELKTRTSVVNQPVDALAHGEQGWGLRVRGDWVPFDQVVLACGANRASGFIIPRSPRLGDLLASIPHADSEIWTCIFQREDVPHPLDAFGFLVPKKERGKIMACTWVNTKWLGRVPAARAVLRCFTGSERATREDVLAELGTLMGITADPIAVLHHAWPASMPQYTVGHSARIAEAEELLAAMPGLHLAGNAYHGLGIPDCVRSGKRAAEAVITATAG